MKTLTIRLDEELSNELEKIMKIRQSNTASGAIKKIISSWLHYNERMESLTHYNARLIADLERLADIDDDMNENRIAIVRMSNEKDDLIASYKNRTPF